MSLAALTDILGRLCFSIDGFSSALLLSAGMETKEPDGSPSLGSLASSLQSILKDFVSPIPEAKDEHNHRLLSEAVLTLIEGLLWNIPDDLAER